jgi:vancomycin resistance protein YoaR
VSQQPNIKARGRGRGRSPGFWALVAVGALVVACVLAVLVDSAVYYNKVHAGVSVSGVDLGGQTKDEAIACVDKAVRRMASEPVTLTAGDKAWTLTAGDAGADMDVEGAVEAALAVGREHDFFTNIAARWKLYFSRRDLPLSGKVDPNGLSAFVARIAKQLDLQPVDAGLAVDRGGIKIIESVEGHVVDQAGLAERLDGLLVALRSATIEVPIVTKDPAVRAEDNAEAQRQAETMISGPITITAGGKEWVITAEEIASYMGFKSEMKNGVSTLVPFMDATKLQPLLDEIAPHVLTKPTSASFSHDGTHAWVIAGKNGVQLDVEATAQAITAASLLPTGRTVVAVTKVKEPSLTTDEAKAMGIVDKLSSYSTTYSCSTARQINVKLATKYSTNVFLAPGKEYNFDRQIGPRTQSRGWQPAPGITGPNELEDVLGGGICQVSTTMFNAVAGGKAGLKITERHNHSLYIDHYPKGRDATVSGGGKNLRFVNDTDHYIWITGTSNGITTTITVWGTDQGRNTTWAVGDFYEFKPMTKTTVLDPTLRIGKTSLVQSGQDGRKLQTTRVVTRSGKVIHRDVWVSYWPMYEQEMAVGTATTKPTTATTAPPPPTSSTEPAP